MTRGVSILVLLLATAGPALAQEAWVAPPGADALENPFEGDDVAAIDAGREIYEMLCGTCHGDRGDGTGAAGQAWNPPPADFTDPELHRQSDGALYWKIAEGNPPAMIPYKNLLSEEELWQLVIYLREFAPGE